MYQISKFLHDKMRSLRQHHKRHSHSKLRISNSSLNLLPSQQASTTKPSASNLAYSHSLRDYRCQTKAYSLRQLDSCPVHKQLDTVDLVLQCRLCPLALGTTCLHSKQGAGLFRPSLPGYLGSGASLTLLQRVCPTLKLFSNV